MSLRIGIGIGIPFGNKINWSSWWGTRTPSNLIAEVISDTRIDLFCTKNGSGYDGFSWESSPDGINYTELDVTVNNSYSNTGIDVSDSIYYRVRAYKGTQYSPYSNIFHCVGYELLKDSTSDNLSDSLSKLIYSVI